MLHEREGECSVVMRLSVMACVCGVQDGEKEREKRDRDIHSFILGQSWSP